LVSNTTFDGIRSGGLPGRRAPISPGHRRLSLR
jgi:hypothetical protein